MMLIPYEGKTVKMFRNWFDLAAVPEMKTDIKEMPDAYIVEAEMPGIKKENVALVCQNGVLTITAKTSEEKSEQDGSYVRKERTSGEIRRSFALEDIDEENIAAKMEDGILYVTLPKGKPDEKRIAIE